MTQMHAFTLFFIQQHFVSIFLFQNTLQSTIDFIKIAVFFIFRGKLLSAGAAKIRLLLEELQFVA
jgi:hypothetical protein